MNERPNELDEIDEIRRIRHEISEQHGHDVERLVAHYMKLQEELRASGKYRFAEAKKAVGAGTRDE